MGGEKANPSISDVASGRTQHRETVKVVLTRRVSYQQLLSAFWRMHDPSDATGSFVDGVANTVRRFTMWMPNSGDWLKVARRLDASGKFDTPIATSIEPASAFYVAEAIIRTII